MMPKTRALAMCGMVALLFASGAKIAAEPSATPRLDWLFSGHLLTSARIGNTLYMGGSFASVSPTADAPGYVVAISATTGAVVPPRIASNASVYAIEPDGGGGYYLSQANSVLTTTASSTTAVVHARADGSLDPSFSSAAIGGQFGSLVRVGPSLIVAGGSPNGIAGRVSVRGVEQALVALDPVGGALLPWTPVLPYPNARVVDMETANGILYVLFQPPSLSPGRDVSAYDGTTGVRLWTRPVLVQPFGLPDWAGGLAVAGNRVIVVSGAGLFSLDASSGVIEPGWGGAVTGGPVWDVVVSGPTAFVGGQFTHVYGVPRARVVAIDVATGALTAWNPGLPSEGGQIILAASPSGSVFLTSAGRVIEIDATGTLTPWVPGATFTLPKVLEVVPSGHLLVGTHELITTPGAPRRSLAAFDATTGDLLPAAPVIDPLLVFPSDTAVTGLATAGSTLYLSGSFAGVNGVARAGVAAVDTSSNTVLPWAPAAPARKVVLASAGHVYLTVDDATTGAAQALVRRYDGVSGVQDAAWLPPPMTELIERGGELIAARTEGTATLVGHLDATTGQFREWVRTGAVRYRYPALDRAPFNGLLAVDGDTVYLSGPRPDTTLDRSISDIVLGFHRYTGLQVGAEVVGYINSVTVADGRLIPTGGSLVMTGGQRLEVAEVARPGAFTSWTPDWPLRGAPVHFGTLQLFNFIRGVTGVTVAGDLLVVRGKATGSAGPERMAAYPLAGASVPSNLRTQNAGPNTVFSWDAMVPPPTGGYVIEGGFASGQTAGALAVGNATSVALPMPPGPAFIRVRPQGSTDVSNEIVAGCFAPPLPPTALTTSLTGTNLSLAWAPPAGAVTAYSFSAGATAGSSNAATVALSGTQTSIGGTVPGGTFFARVTATNACGTSGPSGEVFFTIGASDPLPAAPTNLAASVSGSTVTLTWTAPTGAVTGYVLEGGTAAGLANIGTIQLGAVTSFAIPGAPPGAYALRVRAITSAGSGAPSSDVVAVVP